MTDDSRETPELVRASRIEAARSTHHHPWNPRSEIRGTRMSELAGLSRTGVSLVRVPPGRESFVYHLHHREEEWIYILAGTGTAQIDGAEYAVGPGDFMGFATPSVAHHLVNSGEQDLVYLVGGENRTFEIADFPNHNRRMIRRGPEIDIFRLDDARPFAEQDEPDSP